MLNQFFSNQIYLGIAQAAVAGLLALGFMWLARWREIHLEREISISLLRGLVQIVAVGSVLVLLLQGPAWTSVFVLAAMMLAAAGIAARRAGGLPGAFWVSLYGISIGSGLVIALMTWLGVIDSAVSSLIPVGSMLIANSMNTNSLSLDRFRGEVESHWAHRGWISPGRRTPSRRAALRAQRRARQPDPAHRFIALTGDCLDPGLNGRHGAGRRRPRLRRHLPIRRHRHYFCLFGDHLAGQHPVDPQQSLFGRRPVDPTNPGAKRLTM
jgi:hypothetical protein